MPHLP
jgi:hypothetical protein